MQTEKNIKIIKGLKSGNPKIIESFYQDNFKKIRRMILNNSGQEQDAKDIFQEAIMVLLEKVKSHNQELSELPLETYFYGICKYTWMNILRRKKIIYDNETTMNYHINQSFFTYQPEFDLVSSQILYNKYFLKLNNSQQQILNLYLEGKNHNQISKITGYSLIYTRKKKWESKNTLKFMIQNDPIFKELRS